MQSGAPGVGRVPRSAAASSGNVGNLGLAPHFGSSRPEVRRRPPSPSSSAWSSAEGRCADSEFSPGPRGGRPTGLSPRPPTCRCHRLAGRCTPTAMSLILERVPGHVEDSMPSTCSSRRGARRRASCAVRRRSLHRPRSRRPWSCPGLAAPPGRGADSPSPTSVAWRRTSPTPHGLPDEPLDRLRLHLARAPPARARPAGTTLVAGRHRAGELRARRRRGDGTGRLGAVPTSVTPWTTSRGSTCGPAPPAPSVTSIAVIASTSRPRGPPSTSPPSATTPRSCNCAAPSITAMAIGRGGGALGLAAYMAPHHRFLRQLAHDLAEAAGSFPPDPARGPPCSRARGPRRLRHRGPAQRRDARPPRPSRPPADEGGDDHPRAPPCRGAPGRPRARRGPEGPTYHPRVDDDDRRADGPRPGRRSAGDLDVLALLYRRAQRALWLWDTPSAGGPTLARPPARPA